VQQCRAGGDGRFGNPVNVDLVLLNGGINDVNVRAILNPLLDDKSLLQATEQACFTEMAALLREVAMTYSSARIIVLGYYPIVSPQSNLDLLPVLLGALGFAVAGPNGILTALGAVGIRNQLIHRSRLFVLRAHESLARAVATLNSEHKLNGADRAFLAVPDFRDEHAVLAPDALLWGVNDDGSPEDPIAADRARSCRVQKDVIDRTICEHASAGHPNPKGTAYYAQAIEPLLVQVLA
jgi:hypothetical protein